MQDSLLLVMKGILLYELYYAACFYVPSKEAVNLKAGHYW